MTHKNHSAKLIFPNFFFFFAIFNALYQSGGGGGRGITSQETNSFGGGVRTLHNFATVSKGPAESCESASRNESCIASLLFLLQPEDGRPCKVTVLQVLQVLGAFLVFFLRRDTLVCAGDHSRGPVLHVDAGKSQRA